MCGHFRYITVVIILTAFFPALALSARIKDIASIKGIRPNQLFGYGLVVGLNGSGDKGGKGFTVQSLANLLEHMGIHVNPKDIKASNVAAVMVSATLPPFARIGKKLDVTLSSIGDAQSLLGGTLLLTPLKGADGRNYALAQGAVAVGGFSAGGEAGGGIVKNHTTVARITDGATVEREIVLNLNDKTELTMILNNPDFMTATRVAKVINAQFGEDLTKPIDSGTLKIRVPGVFNERVVSLMAQIGNLEVIPDSVAKVIVNEKTGTVVMGDNVKILQVAIAHGNLSIQIKETKEVSQPLPFAPENRFRGAALAETSEGVVVAPGGSTVVVPESDVTVVEDNPQLVLIPEGRTIGDLVNALNAIGVTPRDLITILQTIKAAGALQAKLEII